VRRRDDQPEQSRMAWRPTLAHEIGRDDRLPVSRRERVRHSPEERCADRGHDDPEAETFSLDERRETGISNTIRRLQAGPVRYMRTGPRDCPWDKPGLDTRDVQGTREEILRIGTQLAACASGSTHDDLLPADAIRVVRVVVRHRARAGE